MAHSRRAHTMKQTLELWGKQLAALAWKNVLLFWRNKVASALQVFGSLFFVLLIFAVNEALVSQRQNESDFRRITNPEPELVNHIPDCSEQTYIIDDPCYTFLYSPNNSEVVDRIVQAVRENNVPVIPPSRVRGFENESYVDAWLLANPQRASGAVQFYYESEQEFNYALQVNGTAKFFRGEFEDPNYFMTLPLQVAVERQIYEELSAQENPQWDIYFSEFAHPAISVSALVGAIASTFLFAAAMFGFVIQIGTVVYEREGKLRQAMRNMGLSDGVFWTSWWMWESVLAVFTSTFIVLFGMMFQFDMFLNNAYGVLFLLFFEFQIAMVSVAFFLSTFLSRSSSAVFLGFVFFLFGWIIQTTVVFGFPYSEEFNDSFGWAQVIFALFPPAPFAKGLMDLARATSDESYEGISWSTRNSYCADNTFHSQDDCVFSLQSIYLWLFYDFLIYMALAVYLDKVLPNEYYVRQPVWYIFSPNFWFPKSSAYTVDDLHKTEEAARAAGADLAAGLDEDVKEEESALKERISRDPNPHPEQLEVRGLVKSFKVKGGFFHAVKGNWFSLDKGRIFALLGPNGAGKSTTINLLTGIQPASAGHAFVFGHSVTGSGIGAIRTFTGMCPQFDVLWPELTGEEHLMIFGLIKGFDLKVCKQETDSLLERVHLSGARKLRSSAYSGGMRRRLSVSISLIGDPSVVYLDEPTTGMDPISRRYVWDIIKAEKVNRVIILTTHSMEEADVLGDRIAIIAKGRLRCLGTSVRLKNKFGTGYRLSISLNSKFGALLPRSVTELRDNEVRVPVVDYVQEKLGIEPNEVGQYIHWNIPKVSESQLRDFVEELLAKVEEFGIHDLQLSLTSLEEVFLEIARQAELDAAEDEGRKEKLQILNARGKKMRVAVPIGCERMELEDGRVLNAIWEQDEDGCLVCVSHFVEENREPANGISNR